MYFLILYPQMLLIRRSTNRYVPGTPGACNLRLTTWHIHREMCRKCPKSQHQWKDEDMGIGPGGRGKESCGPQRLSAISVQDKDPHLIYNLEQIYMEKMTKPVFFALLFTKWDWLAGLATKDNNNEGDWSQNGKAFAIQRLQGEVRRSHATQQGVPWGWHSRCVVYREEESTSPAALPWRSKGHVISWWLVGISAFHG